MLEAALINKQQGQVLYRTVAALFIALLVLSGCAHDPYSVVIIDAADTNTGSVDTQSYKVKKGDTLYSIAFRYDTTVAELARLNRIRAPHTIYIGQELLVNGVPASSHTASVKNSSANVPSTPVKAVAKPKVPAKAKPVVVAKPKSPQKQANKAKTMATNTEKWQKPVPLKVSKRFSNGKQLHKGIDYLGSKGTVITAAKSGKVVYAGNGLKAYGLLIIIKHDEQYLSAYAYNQRILVKEGDMVEQGQKIAEMGEKAGKALLHFEIRKNGKPVDPLILLGR